MELFSSLFGPSYPFLYTLFSKANNRLLTSREVTHIESGVLSVLYFILLSVPNAVTLFSHLRREVSLCWLFLACRQQ